MNYLWIMYFFELMILLLMSIAFLTLFERKLIGLIQLRKGPNKNGFLGLMQPFSDGLKLMMKEWIYLLMSYYGLYLICPVLSMMLMFMLWLNLPFWISLFNNNMHIIMIFCIASMEVYVLMLSGWASGCTYGLIGSLRAIAQTVSYEVSMILIMFSVMMLVEEFDLSMYFKLQYYSWFVLMLMPVSMMMFISMLAEIHRTPFDFTEGESELVSGFNVEYMSGPFAMLFVAEYGMLLFMCYFFTLLFLGGNYYSLIFYTMMLLLIFLMIWIRGTFPRMRYDKVMSLVWMNFLPIILSILLIMSSMKIFLLNFII
nr:NADH dehydrogenase subunit 1 [Ceratosolen fusciceps]